MTDACGFLHFSASLLSTLVQCGVIPPLVMKTRGLNEDFSVNVNHSLVKIICFFFFMLLVDL